jgi:hypothetical protein
MLNFHLFSNRVIYGLGGHIETTSNPFWQVIRMELLSRIEIKPNENNFSLIVATRLGFLPTTHKLTPHIKEKKKKKSTKKIYTLQQLIGWLKKKEKRRRRKKEEGRNPRCRADHPGQPPRPSAGSRWP